jgi:hypothetical protein
MWRNHAFWPKAQGWRASAYLEIAGVVAERAFVAEGFGRVNVAFDDEVGVGPACSRDTPLEARARELRLNKSSRPPRMN